MNDQSLAMLINGQRITTGRTFQVINPATEEVIAEAPEVDATCVDQALVAARDAFPSWSPMPLSERQTIILKYADLLEQNRESIIDLLIAETGKPIDNAEYDFGMLTTCGLAAYVYTTNLSRGLRAAAGIDSGSICVNEVHYAVHLPHGGIKQSGVGKDCSRYSIEEYLTLKRVSVLL